ncbi:MAG: GrpB family protein [Nocardiopsaceae bacterium]|nr:GrpB family protein [Nocardiopsaceae bacterium]
MSPNNPSPSLPSRGSPADPAGAFGPHLIGGRVVLAEYDPKWPYLYQHESDRIREHLGEEVLELAHVGSTAVPGLVAKPCVDVLLLVADSADEDAYRPRLEKAGYTLYVREPDWHEHRVFKRPDVNVNLHVFSRGSSEPERMLLFRDRLRADEGDRALYARTKRALAKRRWDRTQDYADAKSEVVEQIIARARSAAGSGQSAV